MQVSPDSVDRLHPVVPFLDIMHNPRHNPTPLDIVVTQTNIYGPENAAAIRARRNQKTTQAAATSFSSGTRSSLASTASPSASSQPAADSWIPVTYMEMLSFIAVIILMGLVQKSNIRDYWTTDSYTSTPGIASIMSRDRFLDIFYNLHLSNNNEPLPDDATAHDKKTHKLAPFLDACNSAFNRALIAGQNVSVDEVMVKFTGRTSMKQYIPAKPVKHGLKFWAIADATTGYLLSARIYSGKDEERDEYGIGVGGSVVCVMLAAVGYLETQRTVFTDNFFSSVSLAVLLLSMGVYLVGTMRTNRRGFPADALSFSDSAATKGDLKVAEAYFDHLGKLFRILTLSWFDKKQVSFISTKHASHDVCSVQRKESHSSTKVDVPSHLAIKSYTAFMGGVDRADRKRGQDCRHFRTHKWWKAGFFFLLDQVCFQYAAKTMGI